MAPTWEELPDAPGGWESLPDAPATPTPTPGPQSFTDKALSFGGDVVDTVAEGVSRVPRNLAKTGANVVKFIDEAHEASPDTGPLTGSPFDLGQKVVSGLIGAGKIAQEKWDSLGTNEKKAMIVRLGTTAAFTVATGGTNLLVQAAAAAGGNLVGGEISEELGYEENTPLFSKEKMKEAGAGFVEGALLTKLLTATGKGLRVAGEKTRGASVPVSDKKLAALGKPGALTGQTTVGKNTGGEMHLVKDMKAGEKTMSKVLLDEFPDTIKSADEFADALNASIKTRKLAKDSFIVSFDRALKNSRGKVRDFTLKDVGIPRVQREITRLKKIGVADDVIADLEAFKEEMSNAFSKPMGQGIGGRMYVRKDFAEMQDVLDGIYKKQRQMKAFDDNVLAQGGINPGAKSHAEAIRIYGDAAADIRKAIAKKASELERKGFLSSGSATKLQTLNEEIHDLMPWRDGSDRFSYADYQTTKQPQPGSLMQAPGSAFSNNQSMKSMATDIATSPITKPILERSRANAALDFAPDAYSNMQDAASLQLGRMPMPNVEGQGLTGRVIGPGQEMLGRGMQAVGASGLPLIGANTGDGMSPLPVLMQQKAAPNSVMSFEGVLSDPLSMEMLQADPDLPPEVLDTLAQVRNGTMYEKLQAFGQLKIAARDKGWFPPPAMQGIHSYTELPGAVYDGQKVLGTITDQAEGHIYLDAVNQIPDVAKRARLKSAYNSPGKYVLEIPSTLKAIPTPEPKKAAAQPEVVSDPASTAKIDMAGGADDMERVVHDY